MKRLLALVLAVIMLCSFMTVVTYADTEKVSATFLYVATNGADSNNGSIDTPFATLNKAVEAARGISGTVVINVRGGEYAMTDTIALTEKDNDLVIRAYGNEKVSFAGGTKIKYSDFAKETDQALLGKIINKSARSKVITADMNKLGIKDLGNVAYCGFGVKSSYAPTLTYNDQYLTLAQYPNDKEYLYTAVIKNDGSKSEKNEYGVKEVQYTVGDTRYKQWGDVKDMWAIGWYVHDWAETITPVTLDVKTGVFTGGGNYTPILTNRRVKFFNIFEELDKAGEYYIDRTSGKLYMIAPDGFKSGDNVTFSSFAKDFITMTGCSNITFQGIRFEGTTQRGIYAKDCKNCTINACELTAIGGWAITFENSYDCTVENSHIHDVGSGGVLMAGGDLPTLTKSNNLVTNCHIERIMRYKLTYTPGITLNGCGNTASHNEINDSPHEGLGYNGVYNIFEYNNIYRVCTDTSDAGAIYTDRNWATRNNEIRYNYFHDLEMIKATTSYEMQAIYLDDMHSCTFVYGNVFYKCDSVALYGGGRENTFVNNLMLECKKPFVMDARGTTWRKPDSNSEIYQKLMKSPWQTELWKTTFPELANILDNNPGYPMNNTIKGNLIYNTPDPVIDPLVSQYGTVEAPVTVTMADFNNYRSQDFTVKETSGVWKKLPDFEQIKMGDIGRKDFTIEDKWVDNAQPSTDEIKVVLNGKNLDFEVAPEIINSRTMVPLRAIFEALGAQVSWDDASKTVTATKGDTTIVMQIGNEKMTKNGQEITLDSVPAIIASRILVPVRAIAESLGSKVDWNGDTKTILIND